MERKDCTSHSTTAQFKEDKELKKLLMEHCFQHKYIYEHEWQSGDIVI